MIPGLRSMRWVARPGVWSARYAGPGCTPDDNIDKMLHEMTQGRSRARSFPHVDGLRRRSNVEITADGALEGSIGFERRGSGGFGYDPIFVLPDGRTLAEVATEEKNQISHRAKAIHALAEKLAA